MMTIDELTEKWNAMPAHIGGFLLVAEDNSLSFHAGYSGESQKCFVVLNSGKVSNIKSSKGIRVRNLRLTDGSYALEFLLIYSSLEELFIKLCWDLMEASRCAQDQISKLVEQYKSWMRLFQQAGSSLMSPESQKGLLGELLYFRSAIEEYGSGEVLTGWTGPDGSDQDYSFSDKWAEIKAVSISADQVSISSLQQLDRSDPGKLIVYFMDKTASHGMSTFSLPDIIETIRCKLQSASEKDEFSCKLAKYGYLDKDASEYAETRYRLAEVREYDVKADFPRLIRANVPVGITKAQYSIDLAIIDSFRR